MLPGHPIRGPICFARRCNPLLPYTHTEDSYASFPRVFLLPDIRIENNPVRYRQGSPIPTSYQIHENRLVLHALPDKGICAKIRKTIDPGIAITTKIFVQLKFFLKFNLFVFNAVRMIVARCNTGILFFRFFFILFMVHSTGNYYLIDEILERSTKEMIHE